VDRLRLPYRSMLTEQGFTIVYAHISKLNVEAPGSARLGWDAWDRDEQSNRVAASYICNFQRATRRTLPRPYRCAGEWRGQRFGRIALQPADSLA
jgi:hypothetical protein